MGVRTKEAIAAPSLDVGDAALRQLRRTFRGELVLPNDPGYDEARRVHNAMVDLRPGLIARCRGTSDVAATVAFCRANDLDLSVRAGGHSIVGHAVMGSVVIDLSLMRGVLVDVANRRARVQGGALWADVDRESQHFGLATTGGLVTSTGVAGLTLGGGYGWLARRFGLACDNLRSAEMVLADGSVVVVDAESHPESFWAIRGGGGNFGVATTLEFDLRPFGPMVSSGDVYYGLADARTALRSFRDVLLDAPDELYLATSVAIANEATPVPAERRGEPVVHIAWAWVGDRPAEGEVATAPLHRAGTPIAQTVDEVEYVTLQTGPGLDRAPRRLYWKSSFLYELPDPVLDTFLQSTIEINAGHNLIEGEMLSMGGMISRVADDATAYSHRDALVDFLAVAAWVDPAEDDARLGAGRDLWGRISGAAGRGVYVNNLGSEGQDRVREAYGTAKYDRLAAIKARLDPDNVFRHNANIQPAARG